MIRWCVDHPIATWMLFAALVVTGIYAVPRLKLEAMPETELPSLSVVTTWNGASPAAVQRSLTVPVEEAARRVHGVETIESMSRPGNSTVKISFRRDVDVEFARLELAEQVGALRRDLPATASPPRIVPYVPQEFRTGEFFTVSLVSPLPPNELRERAEQWLVARLLAVPGVADVELQGGARPLLKVRLHQDLLERYRLHPDEVYAQLAALDDIVPAGAIRRRGRELIVSIQDSLTVDRIAATIIAVRGGQPLTLARIADLAADFEDPTHFVRINGENVIQAVVSKRSGSNAVAVSRRLRTALRGLEDQAPFPVRFEVDKDQGRELEDKLRELIGRSLVILLLLFVLLATALRAVRLTAIVVASILLAIVVCLSLFYFLGLSVNFITISGLTITFGMLLDNSILVLDGIHRRLTVRRRRARTALLEGTREVAFPITATTLTTVVAFLSFLFLSGRLALYYVPLAVSVGIAMLASIFVAFGWIPVALRGTARREAAHTAAAGAGAPGRRSSWPVWSGVSLLIAAITFGGLALAQGWRPTVAMWPWFAGGLAVLLLTGGFSAHVETITRFHLRHWWYPLLLLVAAGWGGWHLYRHEIDLGGFWRQQDRQRLVLYLERPVGTDVELTSATMADFERELLPLPDGITMKTTCWSNRAFMEITFDETMLTSEYPELLRNQLILRAEQLGGMFIWINGFGDPYMKGGRGGGMSNSLIRITGYNAKVLDDICRGVMARLERTRRVRNPRLTGGDRFDRADNSETIVEIDRTALARHHLTVAEVVGQLRRLLGIEVPWHMLVEGRDRRLQLTYAEADRIQFERIAAHTFRTRAGDTVRLGDLVRLVQRPVVTTITRKDQRYSMQITWEYIGTDRMRRRYIQRILDGLQLPYGYDAEDVTGERFTGEEQQELNRVLWLTAAFILMTLAALFESLSLPLLVLLAVPMALSGVMVLFWLADATFDSSARIGLVLLFGIVVNNAILLVNRFRLQVRELVAGHASARRLVPARPRLGGGDLWPLPDSTRSDLLRRAIAEGTRIQLRSILLTSGTTIAGMLPLLVRLRDATGKDIWENLALSSVGGLASSTLLIVACLPALYWTGVRAGWRLAELRQRWRRWRDRHRPAPGASGAVTRPPRPAAT